MKLAAPIRRHFRRPPRLQQQVGFFAKEGESPAFFQPGSEARMKDTGSFFSAKGPEEEPQAKEPAEQETPAAKESEEEPVKSKASEEEEPVKAKLKGDEGKPIAAKCSCGCGGSGTCGKSAPSAEDREQSKAPANDDKCTSTCRGRRRPRGLLTGTRERGSVRCEPGGISGQTRTTSCGSRFARRRSCANRDGPL